jgi:hypothetical protein
MPLEKRPDRQPDSVHGHPHPEREDRQRRGSDDFFGLDVESMSPRAQITASLAVLVPVTVGAQSWCLHLFPGSGGFASSSGG